MNIQERYHQVLQQVQSGARGLQQFKPDEIRTLQSSLTSDVLRPTLFLLMHSAYPHQEFEAPLLAIFERELSVEENIFFLNALRLHIVEARFKKGERLTHEFLEKLKRKLYHPDPRVKEWGLRLIDQCGTQAIVFRPDLAKIKPRLWQLWRAEQRTVLELVVFLERKWAIRENT